MLHEARRKRWCYRGRGGKESGIGTWQPPGKLKQKQGNGPCSPWCSYARMMRMRMSSTTNVMTIRKHHLLRAERWLRSA